MGYIRNMYGEIIGHESGPSLSRFAVLESGESVLYADHNSKLAEAKRKRREDRQRERDTVLGEKHAFRRVW